jgi:hydroxymethylglutaryl-CoA reductase
MTNRSVLPKFYTHSVNERLRILLERGIIGITDYQLLVENNQVLSSGEADALIENVIGVFGLPMALGLNFEVNSTDYLVPMVVEEPSIVAALSAGAKIVRQTGGFKAQSDESLLIGQIQIVELRHAHRARSALKQRRQEIIDLANNLHPRMIARGGGVRDIEVFLHPRAEHASDMLVVHLLVDTQDAMGANLVNTMCEGVAPLVEKIAGGKVFLRILSNLTDRSIVTSTCTIHPDLLKDGDYTGEQVRDGIVLASEFAAIDPYRATTHNKGIMNGIDAVALASGNDWRAIEAAAHAYAGRGNGYTSLSKWFVGDDGSLVGEIEIPLKVGIVGGSLKSNPAVALALRLLQVKNSKELACLMASVGLAQNFSALRALSTEGIQRGHMTLHARSCAVAAGAKKDDFEEVVEKLIASGQIKEWKAKEIIEELKEGISTPQSQKKSSSLADTFKGISYGKVILLGEHAVVYGSHAIAAPLPLAVEACVVGETKGLELLIPRWGVEDVISFDKEPDNVIRRCMHRIVHSLKLENEGMRIEVIPHVPRAMGLGSSASLAVAVIRALTLHFKLNLDDRAVNELAFECETIAHGTPSGIDNTLATFGQFTLFRKKQPNLMQPLNVKCSIPIVLGLSNQQGSTARMVAQVSSARQKDSAHFDRIFEDIDRLTLEAVDAIETHDLNLLGQLMNLCQGFLNGIGVSTWELEELIGIARKHGAFGAKLTGSGGGGSMIALCPNEDPAIRNNIVQAMQDAGYRAMPVDLS